MGGYSVILARKNIDTSNTGVQSKLLIVYYWIKGLALVLKLPISRKTADKAAQGIVHLLKSMKDVVHTITFDNGREFNKHNDIAKLLDCDTYFAKPYQSWQRGLNENHNGLLRQFISKSLKLDKIDIRVVAHATTLMNNRPRKCLGYKTPIEVFTELTGKNYFLDESFALMG